MTQADWLTLTLKITLISGIVSLLAWVGVYSKLTDWRWARNPVGRSIVYLALLSAASMTILTAAMFARFGHLGGEIAGWVYAAVIGLTTPAMVSRIVVWLRLHQADRLPSDAAERIAELEAENAALRERLAQGPGEVP